MCYPKGAHSWHHRLGQLPASGCKFNFPLCYPKGAHSLHHRLGQFPTSGCKFNFPLCYPKGAHSLHHRLGQFPTSGAKFNFPSCYPRGAHSLGHRRGNYSLLFSNIVKTLRSMFFSEHRLKIALLRIGKHCIVKNIASLRKVNIAHPYTWLKAKQRYVECLSLENFIKR